VSGKSQKPRGLEVCSVTISLWLHALAKAGGDRRRFEWDTWPMRFVPSAKA